MTRRRRTRKRPTLPRRRLRQPPRRHRLIRLQIDCEGGDIVNPINTTWTLVGCVPRVRHAGWFHDARSRFLPFARNRQRIDGVYRRHVSLRHSLLCVWLCVHVRPWQWLHRPGALNADGSITPGSSCRTHRRPTKARALRSWPTGCSSSPLPTPARRSPRAR